jgi:SAM-dependent methyltransferase
MTPTGRHPRVDPDDYIPGVFRPVRSYYSERVVANGPTPAGVDWPDASRQTIRFRELARLFPTGGEPFSILDYGCGYGALRSYLRGQEFLAEYSGFDISEQMIATARLLFPEAADCFHTSLCTQRRYDYVIASGVFNVKLDAAEEAWESELWNIIELMNTMSLKGFGFNVLSSWRKPGRKKDFLYYGDPASFLNRLKQYSSEIALLHNYGLWDFTVLIRKDISRNV